MGEKLNLTKFGGNADGISRFCIGLMGARDAVTNPSLVYLWWYAASSPAGSVNMAVLINEQPSLSTVIQRKFKSS